MVVMITAMQVILSSNSPQTPYSTATTINSSYKRSKTEVYDKRLSDFLTEHLPIAKLRIFDRIWALGNVNISSDQLLEYLMSLIRCETSQSGSTQEFAYFVAG